LLSTNLGPVLSTVKNVHKLLICLFWNYYNVNIEFVNIRSAIHLPIFFGQSTHFLVYCLMSPTFCFASLHRTSEDRGILFIMLLCGTLLRSLILLHSLRRITKDKSRAS
jgi:hypothetical protein